MGAVTNTSVKAFWTLLAAWQTNADGCREYEYIEKTLSFKPLNRI
jgi:hypothetical protein